MINNKTLLTPIALAAALGAGVAHADPAGGRLAGAVSRVTDALRPGAAPSAQGAESRGLRSESLSSRDGDDDRRLQAAFARNDDGERGSLLGLTQADRDIRRVGSDERRTYDPQGLALDLNVGNTDDSPDALTPGLRISHDSTMHLRTEEDDDSPFDNGDETARSGLATGTSVHVIGSRENDDGERERVAYGVETGGNLFNHVAHEDRDDVESYRTAEVSGFVTERRVEEGVIDEEDDSNRRGGTTRYDSREGFSFEGGDDDDR